MPLELKKVTPMRLRLLGLDERWLQVRIEEDPSLLGLGDINVVRREKSQPSGGRLDFLMYDPDRELRYEVEIMLGVLDESHIIRTIEYWDIERQRFPAYDHRAVIVAEEITARFFNIIRLLNRAVPVIAIQLNAFSFDNSVVLHFTKVLDVFEEAGDVEDAGGEPVDRRYWEQRAGFASLAVLDHVVALVEREIGPPRVTYNKNHVALGTGGYNFCWFVPRKSTPHCHTRLKTGAETREVILRQLEDAGIGATPFQSEVITIKLLQKHLDDGRAIMLDVLRHCERQSKTNSEQEA
jgi:hypothetical protein